MTPPDASSSGCGLKIFKNYRRKRKESLARLVKEVRNVSIEGTLEALIAKIDLVRQEKGRCLRAEAEALQCASGSGNLLHLLEAFEMPLAQFPHLAREEVRFFSQHCEARSKRGSGFLSSSTAKENQGLLVILANFIKVPGPAAEELLEEVVEEVLSHKDHNNYPQADPPFPVALRPFYMKRWLPGVGHAKYDPKYPTRMKIEGALYQISPVTKVTVPRELRFNAKIPLDSAYFAFVYNGAALPTGGYVYFDEEKEVVAINVLSVSHFPNALTFGTYELIAADASEEIRRASPPHDVSVEELRAKGVREYAWIGPEVQCLKKNNMGGFAYFFEDEKENRFFPLEGIIELNDEAFLSWEMNAAVLGQTPDEEAIEQELLQPSSFWFASRRPTTVKLKRVSIPNVVNPIVLQAIASTPRFEALRTQAAKAIVHSAWPKVRCRYHLDFVLVLLEAMALLWFTTSRISHFLETEDKRLNELPEPVEIEGFAIPMPNAIQTALTWEDCQSISFFILFVSVCKKILEEIICVCRWRKYGMLSDYFHKAKICHTLFRWLGIVIILMVLVCSLSAPREEIALRMLLGAGGICTWMEVLFHFRAHQVLGPKILPILRVFSDVWGFTLVMFFMILAFLHSTFALSHRALLDVAMSTFRMALLGDFDIAEHVLGVEDVLGDETNREPVGWSGYQHLFFMFTTFMLTVVMTNLFIGVICNSYDIHQNEAVELFIQARAEMTLDYMLLPGLSDLRKCFSSGVRRFRSARSACLVEELECAKDDEYVWFCTMDTENADGEDDVATEGSVRSVMRTEMRSVRSSIKREIVSVLQQMRNGQKDLGKQIEALPQKISQPTEDLAASRRWRQGPSALPSEKEPSALPSEKTKLAAAPPTELDERPAQAQHQPCAAPVVRRWGKHLQARRQVTG
jgi:hypothetical protein